MWSLSRRSLPIAISIKTFQHENFSWLLHILMATYTCPHTGTYSTSLLPHFFVSLYKNTLQNDPLYPLIPFPPLSPSSNHAYWFPISTLHKNLLLELLVASILSNLIVNLQPSSEFSSQQHLPWLIPPFFLAFFTWLPGHPHFWFPCTSLASSSQISWPSFLKFSPRPPCLQSICPPSVIPIVWWLYGSQFLYLPTLTMHLLSRFIHLFPN